MQWIKPVQESFLQFLYVCPNEILPSVIANIPFDVLSSHALVLMSLIDGGLLKPIEKSMSDLGKLPFSLEAEEIEGLAYYIIGMPLKRSPMPVLNALLGEGDRVALLTKLCCRFADISARNSLAGKPPSQQPWAEFSRSKFFEEIAAAMPPDNFMGCFCRLCYGMQPYRLSNDPLKVNAFFSALPSGENATGSLLMFLLSWPDVEPDFLVELFKRSDIFQDKDNRYSQDRIWLHFAGVVERMTNKLNRSLVAEGFLKLMKKGAGKKTGWSFKKAVAMLERLSSVKKTG
jgi:hypothetical protein